jgi:hypothetical protein
MNTSEMDSGPPNKKPKIGLVGLNNNNNNSMLQTHSSESGGKYHQIKIRKKEDFFKILN